MRCDDAFPKKYKVSFGVAVSVFLVKQTAHIVVCCCVESMLGSSREVASIWARVCWLPPLPSTAHAPSYLEMHDSVRWCNRFSVRGYGEIFSRALFDKIKDKISLGKRQKWFIEFALKDFRSKAIFQQIWRVVGTILGQSSFLYRFRVYEFSRTRRNPRLRSVDEAHFLDSFLLVCRESNAINNLIACSRRNRLTRKHQEGIMTLGDIIMITPARFTMTLQRD